ncbi:hypothetical protein SK128_012041, partial [Halocaridina rubra]
ASEKHNTTAAEVSQSNTVCPWDTSEEIPSSVSNICPWESSAPPSAQAQVQIRAPEQRLSHPKTRPDRSKSVDVSSLPKRQGSVSVAPSLTPVLTEGQPTASVCPWESQELPNRTTEKSKSIDVDVCPWEASSEPAKKASSSSAPGTVAIEHTVTQLSSLQTQVENVEKAQKSISCPASKERSSKEGARPPCERKISIQVCPWEEVEEETVVPLSHSSSGICNKPQGRQPSEMTERRLEFATKPKEKHISSSGESQTKPESLAVQTALETRIGISNEGASSPSSTCSSSSHSDSRRIKIDYTVRSGHLPGQYGLPVISAPAATVISATAQSQIVSTSCNTSITSSNSSITSSHQQATGAESPRAIGNLSCPTEGVSSRPSSPKATTNVVAPWEDNPPQKMTDICPWEDE